MTVEIHRLSNGLRIVTEHMPSLASASVGIWVNVGGRHEEVSQNGIAHFLEHMAFKGTKTRSALQIAEEIEDVGGFINAYTSREMTAYYARVLGADVPLALDVISDILVNPVFDPKEIEVERGVILQEIGQSLDTPDDIIFDWLQETSYPDQPMGRPILGPAERVSAFQREDLASFVDHFYGPEQMILAAAGDVNHDQIVRLAEKLFGHIPRRNAPSAQAALYRGGERREVKDLEQAHFCMAMAAPGYRDDDIYAAQVYAGLLGGGMSSRLFQEVREKRGLCYTIFAQPSAYADSGAMMIYAGTSGTQIKELTAVVTEEILRAGSSLRVEEVDRARAQMKAGLLMGLESPSSRCERIARMISIWDRVPTLEETIARIDDVSLLQVSDFATSLCANADPAVALYGPVADAPSQGWIKEQFAA